MHWLVTEKKEEIPSEWVNLSEFTKIVIVDNLQEGSDEYQGSTVAGYMYGVFKEIKSFKTRREAEIWCSYNIPIGGRG